MIVNNQLAPIFRLLCRGKGITEQAFNLDVVQLGMLRVSDPMHLIAYTRPLLDLAILGVFDPTCLKLLRIALDPRGGYDISKLSDRRRLVSEKVANCKYQAVIRYERLGAEQLGAMWPDRGDLLGATRKLLVENDSRRRDLKALLSEVRVAENFTRA